MFLHTNLCPVNPGEVSDGAPLLVEVSPVPNDDNVLELAVPETTGAERENKVDESRLRTVSAAAETQHHVVLHLPVKGFPRLLE